jgi:hypothetical protein
MEQEKTEVHHAHTEHHTEPAHHHVKKEKKMGSKFLIMAVLLGLLIVVAGFQSVQLVGLKDKVSEGMPALSAGGSSSSGGSSVDSLKKNLDSLPTMVGGC